MHNQMTFHEIAKEP